MRIFACMNWVPQEIIVIIVFRCISIFWTIPFGGYIGRSRTQLEEFSQRGSSENWKLTKYYNLLHFITYTPFPAWSRCVDHPLLIFRTENTFWSRCDRYPLLIFRTENTFLVLLRLKLVFEQEKEKERTKSDG